MINETSESNRYGSPIYKKYNGYNPQNNTVEKHEPP